ncbi:hypothetical protein D3C73_1382540 [compost metagenome]
MRHFFEHLIGEKLDEIALRRTLVILLAVEKPDPEIGVSSRQLCLQHAQNGALTGAKLTIQAHNL